MAAPYHLLEVSWEVANKVGGIHTVVSSKARTMVEELGDAYVAIGPWLLSETTPFDDEDGYDAFVEGCRAAGAPVRVGRWRIPGAPRTILVAFSELYARKDGILAGLWERHGVDSLAGAWDYVEPVLFAHAAGIVIERWWATYRPGLQSRAVAHFHEWMTGAGLLYLRDSMPEVATVFTTHATVVGRAAVGRGVDPTSRPADDLAAELAVVAKHSLERACAREADVFTTVSALTADEAEHVLGRRPEPITPNGIDLEVIDALVGGTSRQEARAALEELATRFLGSDVSGAAFLCTSGRYEFHNKGMDVLLDALGALNANPGPPAVLFMLVPAGNSGPRGDLLARMARPVADADGPLGIATHHLFEPSSDPIQARCAEQGIDNAPGSRIRVIHVPLYLRPGDGLLDLPYEAVLQAMDLSCFPSAYEPWGYTPQESLAVGVPTVTSDRAGFGRWCIGQLLGPDDGVYVLHRDGASAPEAAERLAHIVSSFLASPPDAARISESCRRTARRTSWSDLAASYRAAYGLALDRADKDGRRGVSHFTATVAVPPRPDGERTRPRMIPFGVRSTLPTELAGLNRLVRNLWWTGDPEAEVLLATVDRELWERTGHNPVAMLRRASFDALAARAADPDYVERLGRAVARMDEAVSGPAATLEHEGRVVVAPDRPIAYFCLEYGLHESLPIYSGGLGVLAGDHLKSASDRRLPVVAVGMLYRQGYFRQQMSDRGEQRAEYLELDPAELPLEPVRGADGRRLELQLTMPGGQLTLWAWLARVGRVPLYLLDTNVPANRPEDRDISRLLYGGDDETRLRQEIVLGKGGVRLLHALGIRPAVFHLNEGHAALAGLERISHLLREEGLTFDQAREVVRATTVFTTHTPVPAGHDRFGPSLTRRYFSDAPAWIGVPWERFCALGADPDAPETFSMTALAVNLARRVNAVSRLHREVSRDMLREYWPGRLPHEVPVASVTNGVHLPTWTERGMAALVSGNGRAVRGRDFAERAEQLEDRALWDARARARRRLLGRARRLVEQRFVARHDSPRLLTEIVEGLSDDRALVIGFARRFAPYKRADLLFAEPDRLAALLADDRRPVRILVAGKAHPRDGQGQALLAEVVSLSRDPRFVGRAVFLEDHDMALARYLVAGSDVWLNTPTHGLEASGTSGMKAAANGALNLSILDGWWPEAHDGTNGWAIGGRRVFEDQELQDELDAASLYHLLEEEIVPLFFERDAEDVPHAWLRRVKRSLATIPPSFSAGRMVDEYRDWAYVPLAAAGQEQCAGGYAAVRQSVDRLARVRRALPEVSIVSVRAPDLEGVKVGDRLGVEVDVRLGDLTPDDVVVELVVGPAEPRGDDRPETVALEVARQGGDAVTFAGSQEVRRAGSFAYGVRVRARGEPGDDDPTDPIIWA